MLHLLVNAEWFAWAYASAGCVASAALGLGAYRIHDPEKKSGDTGSRRHWQKWFNAAGSGVGWLCGWVVLCRWFGCPGFVCADEPRITTVLVAAIAFAGIAGQLPYALMNSLNGIHKLLLGSIR